MNLTWNVQFLCFVRNQWWFFLISSIMQKYSVIKLTRVTNNYLEKCIYSLNFKNTILGLNYNLKYKNFLILEWNNFKKKSRGKRDKRKGIHTSWKRAPYFEHVVHITTSHLSSHLNTHSHIRHPKKAKIRGERWHDEKHFYRIAFKCSCAVSSLDAPIFFFLLFSPLPLTPQENPSTVCL